MLSRRGNSVIASCAGISISFLIAFCLMIFPLPSAVTFLRPDFIMLLVVYWSISMPERFGILISFLIGIFYDLLTGHVFGVMGLTISILAFLSMHLRLRLKILNFSQQSILIFLLLATAKFIFLCVQMILNKSSVNFIYWISCLSSALCWPLVYSILNNYQRVLRIY